MEQAGLRFFAELLARRRRNKSCNSSARFASFNQGYRPAQTVSLPVPRRSSVANGNGKKKKRKGLYITLSIVAVALIVVIFVAAKSGGAKLDPSKLAKVERGDLAKSVVATGKITPITKVEIKSKASGIVKRLLVDEGMHVTAGQALAELDRDEIQAQVNQVKAQLEAADANLHAAEADYERSKVDAQGVDIPMLKR